MRAMCRGLAFGLVVVAFGAGGVQAQQAAPQHPAPQFYGYPSAQKSMPSGQGNNACQPETGYGCHVYVCPCPSGAGEICERLKHQIPPIQPVPTCHEVPVCEIIDEGPPPSPPRDVTIYRNAYVPIRIVTVPGNPNAVPVNIHVKWREVHVLCGADGKPLSSGQASAVLEQLNAQVAAVAAAPAAPMAPAPAPVVAVEKAAEKRWIWLPAQKVYGYGFQRADGLWVIDEGTKRPAPPTVQSAVSAPLATTTAAN